MKLLQRTLPYFLIALLGSAPAVAEMPLLAVLEFDSGDKALSADDMMVLTDAARGAVVREVGGRFKVLTRETMTELVPPERLNCFVDKCAAEIGRMLQASHVIAGTLRRFGSRLILTIEAYESTTGRLLGSDQVRATQVDELLDLVVERMGPLAQGWFAPAPIVEPPVVKESPPPTPAAVVPTTPPAKPTTSPEPTPLVAPTSESTPTSDRRAWALRAGLSGQAGQLGVALEFRPSWWGLSIGTGWIPLSVGLNFGSADNDGGIYGDLHAMRVYPWPVGTIRANNVENGGETVDVTGFAVGGTVGYDWRLARDWSLKTGLGLVWTTFTTTNRLPLSADLAFGRLF